RLHSLIFVIYISNQKPVLHIQFSTVHGNSGLGERNIHTFDVSNLKTDLMKKFLLLVPFLISAACFGQAPNTWVRKADLPGPPRRWAVEGVIGNKGYVGTGDTGYYRKDFWEWSQTSDSWIRKADYGGAERHL